MKAFILCLLILAYSLSTFAQESSLPRKDKWWFSRKEKRQQFWVGAGPFIQLPYSFSHYSSYRKRSFYERSYPSFYSTAKLSAPIGLAIQISSLTRLNRWFSLMATLEANGYHQYIQWYSYDKDPYGYTLNNYDSVTNQYSYTRNYPDFERKNVHQIDFQVGLNWSLAFQSPGGRFGLRPAIRIYTLWPTAKSGIGNNSIGFSPAISAFYSITNRLRAEVQFSNSVKYFHMPNGYLSYNQRSYLQTLFTLQYQLSRPKE